MYLLFVVAQYLLLFVILKAFSHMQLISLWTLHISNEE